MPPPPIMSPGLHLSMHLPSPQYFSGSPQSSSITHSGGGGWHISLRQTKSPGQSESWTHSGPIVSTPVSVVPAEVVLSVVSVPAEVVLSVPAEVVPSVTAVVLLSVVEVASVSPEVGLVVDVVESVAELDSEPDASVALVVPAVSVPPVVLVVAGVVSVPAVAVSLSELLAESSDPQPMIKAQAKTGRSTCERESSRWAIRGSWERPSGR
jgi:hypothetical protein